MVEKADRRNIHVSRLLVASSGCADIKCSPVGMRCDRKMYRTWWIALTAHLESCRRPLAGGVQLGRKRRVADKQCLDPATKQRRG